MTRVVWKFPLASVSVQEIDLPFGAAILHVAEQAGELHLWALCDPSAPRVPRGIAMIDTGAAAPVEEGRHVGTLLLMGGALVKHVFEQVPQ